MKKAFTLIEILLSLMILSILFLAMSGVISSLKNSKKVLDNYYLSSKENELLVKTLYGDLVNATSVKVVHSRNSDYDRIYLTTSNSLYHLISPYVLWYVSKNEDTLIRIESPFVITIPNDNLFFLDKFKSGVKLFKIYQKEGKYLVFLKADKNIYFEIFNKEFKKVSKNSKKLDKNSSNSSSSTTPPITPGGALPTF